MQPYREIQTIWSKMVDGITPTGTRPFADLDLHKLNHVFSVGDSYYFVLNVTTADVEFTSPEITSVLGYSPAVFSIPFAVSCIHPEDISWVLDFEQAALTFFQSLPQEKVPAYKTRYDYRIRKSDGSYARVLQQSVTIETGPAGEILKTLSVHTDITHIKTAGRPMLSFIGLGSVPSHINVTPKSKFAAAKEVLSKREKEILIHLVNGRSSAEIAKLLFLSKFTVDTHRRNMIRKTGVKRNAELVSMAIKKGFV